MINEWPRLYFSFWYFYSTAEKSELGCLQQNGPALRLPARKSQSTIFSWWSFWTGFSQRNPFFLPSKTAWAAATSESTYPPNEPFISPSLHHHPLHFSVFPICFMRLQTYGHERRSSEGLIFSVCSFICSSSVCTSILQCIGQKFPAN